MNIANFFSALRLALLPFFLMALMYYSPGKEYLRYIAIFLVLLSFLTDALDGFLARKHKIVTNLGAFLDPLGDKLLLNSAFLVLILKPEFKNNLSLPMWVVGTVFLKDILLALGSFLLALKGRLTIAPSYLGKTAVFLQMFSILSALFYLPITYYLWVVTGVVTFFAALGYFKREIPKFCS